MKKTLAATIVACLLICPALSSAQAVSVPQTGVRGSMTQPEATPLATAARRHASRAAGTALEPKALRQPGAPAQRGWIGRHPALFGALVGAGAGTVAAGTMENELFCSRGDEDCLFHGGGRLVVGAGIGAGIGALVGWIAGLGLH